MTLQKHFARGKERVMPIERGSCRFNLRKTSEGKPVIEMEMFHNTVPHLPAVILSFEVLTGITLEQTRDLIEKMNDQIVGAVVTPK
jgi:hypothetical protein